MRAVLFLIFLFLISNSWAAWQRELSVGGSDLDSSAIYQVNSVLKGAVYAPKMDETERDAISAPTSGLGVYNTDTNLPDVYNGTSWLSFLFTTATQTVTNKTIDADLNTLSNVDDGNIKVGAAIARTKTASATANYVLINNGSGVMSEEQFLAKTRGGTGITSTATFPSSGTVATLAATETFTNKTYSGGAFTGLTASTTNQWLPPDDTKANLITLCATLTAGSIVHASDEDVFYHCDGTTLTELGGAGASLVVVEVYRDTAVQTVTSGSTDVVDWEAEHVDTDSAFSLVTDIFTAPRGAYYTVGGSLFILPTTTTPTTNSRNVQLELSTDSGSTWAQIDYDRVSTADIAESRTQKFMAIGFWMDTGDLIRVQFNNATDESLNISFSTGVNARRIANMRIISH